MLKLIKKFASYLIFGKISEGYKESDMFDVKHVIDDPVHGEKPAVCQKYYTHEAIFHLELDDEIDIQHEDSDFTEADTNHLFQVKRKIGKNMVSEDESLFKKHQTNIMHFVNKYASDITVTPKTNVSAQFKAPTPVVNKSTSAFMKNEFKNEYKIYSRNRRPMPYTYYGPRLRNKFM